MKRLKTQKGITLVALVITIIVLLILAVVAIGAVRDSGIIGHAQNSADKYNTEKNKEESMLGDYEDVISGYYSSNGDINTDGIEQDAVAKRLQEIAVLDYADISEEEEESLDAEYESIIGEEYISFCRYTNNDEIFNGYLYNPVIQKFFKCTFLIEVDDEERAASLKIINVPKEDEGSNILEELIEFKEYLEKEFVGKTYEQMQAIGTNEEIAAKIKNEFEGAKNFIDFDLDLYSDELEINFDIESKNVPGEYFNVGFDLYINSENGIENVTSWDVFLGD